MEHTVFLSWKGQESEYRPKPPSWYWAIGIAAAGISIAAALVSNYLFSLISLLGGFAIMVVGSRHPSRHVYKLTDRGVMIGVTLIPFEKISRFAIRENEPQTLVLETSAIVGTINIPLTGVDWRTISMELKNRNIEETESLGSFIDTVERALGL